MRGREKNQDEERKSWEHESTLTITLIIAISMIRKRSITRSSVGRSVTPSISSGARIGNLIWRTSKAVERTDLLEEQAELVCPSGRENSSFVPRRGASYFRPILERERKIVRVEVVPAKNIFFPELVYRLSTPIICNAEPRVELSKGRKRNTSARTSNKFLFLSTSCMHSVYFSLASAKFWFLCFLLPVFSENLRDVIGSDNKNNF